MNNLRLILFFLVFACYTLQAQDIKSPQEFLGYDLGTHFTPHYQVTNYIKHVAENSDQVQLQKYGESYEGNSLILAYLSSKENMKQLDSLRLDNLKKAGLHTGKATMNKTIVWLSYNIHGNEAVSSEAALETIYQLITNKKYQKWLGECIVIIDPCLNPDGRERYIGWYKQKVGHRPNPNPETVEHREEWPGGRYNHYYFDLNRDWLWLTQKESQLRIEQYNQWLPHVHVDFHEQGVNSPYYFPPAAEPIHELISPWQRKFQEAIGQNHATYFDQQGWLYFTKERFDLLYPSYGDTYPTFNGAIGMTYEQGGSGRAGLMVLTETNDTLTLKDRIDHHVTTGLSTVETSFRNAEKLKTEFAKFYTSANITLPYRWYVIKSSSKPGINTAVQQLFDQHLIKYHLAEKGGKGIGFNFFTKKEQNFSFSPNDIIINTKQPKAALLKVLLESKTKLSDSITYDITAWALPYAMGLETYGLNKKPEATNNETSKAVALPAMKKDSVYAYLLPWQDDLSVKMLAQLLKKKIKVRYSEEPFRLAGKEYGRGSIVVNKVENNHVKNIHFIIESLSKSLAITFTPVKSGMVTKGKDLGSGSFKFIKPPKVALFTGDDLSANSVGELWHLFDYTFDYPLHRLPPTSIDNLEGYDVAIFPEGRYSTIFSEGNLEALQQWIKNGGKAIFLENAAQSLAGKSGWGIEKQQKEEAEISQAVQKAEKLKTYADRIRDAVSKRISGSIYKVSMDNTHPLAMGYESTYYTLKSTSRSYALMENAWNVGWLDGTAEPVSGFAGANVTPKPEDTLIMGVKPIGSGQAIYFMDNPVFRLFWRNGFLAIGNAVFLVQ